MTDKYTDDLGDEIYCANCGTLLSERYTKYDLEKMIFINPWYCSNECYEEKTKDEGL